MAAVGGDGCTTGGIGGPGEKYISVEICCTGHRNFETNVTVVRAPLPYTCLVEFYEECVVYASHRALMRTTGGNHGSAGGIGVPGQHYIAGCVNRIYVT